MTAKTHHETPPVPPPSQPPPLSAPRRATAADLALVAVLIAALEALLYHFWFVCDDAFITFRYARNLATGNGLVYNVGERVEGYSNFLWTLLCAALYALRLNLPQAAPALSAACAAGLVTYVYVSLRRHLLTPPLPAGLATAFMSCSMPFVVWSTGGLETMAFSLALFALFERLILTASAGVAAREQRRGKPRPSYSQTPARAEPATRGDAVNRWISTGVIALLVALLRTEGVCWVLVVVLLAAIGRWLAGAAVGRPLATVAGVLLVGFGAFFAWRYSYYGAALSNTAAAKAEFSPDRLSRGFDYVAVLFLTVTSFFAIIPAIPVVLRTRPWSTAVPLALMALAFPAYAVVVSGDFMTFGRFVVPSLPFMALCVGPMLAAIDRGGVGRRALAALLGAGLIALGLLPGWDVHLVPESIRARHHFRKNTPKYQSELAQWKYQKENAADWALQGAALRQIARAGDSLVIGAIGAVGYYSELYIFDKFGLVTPAVAQRQTAAAADRSPGHDKLVEPDWFIQHGDRPTFLDAKLIREPSRMSFAQALQGYASLLAVRLKLGSMYVPRFAELRVRGETSDLTQYLLYWERLDDPSLEGPAWTELRRLLQEYVTNGSIRVIEIDRPK
ncbi:MAG: hypothetical protein CHACPFDD_01744 [Phycisphaerae bacterium]|nr:hypothetical protein [Phycisphaerae bacterium]